jgi:hypothetical protein
VERAALTILTLRSGLGALLRGGVRIVHWRPRNAAGKRISQPDAFYLAQCNLVLCSVVKFGCSRRLVSRHLLGVLQPSVVFQVNRDAGCSPGVTSNGVRKPAALARLRTLHLQLGRNESVERILSLR